MSLYVNCEALSKALSLRKLFDKLSFTISAGDRIGLIGPNGSGKTTLLKILAGQEPLDSGLISMKRGLQVGYVPQSEEFSSQSPREILSGEVKDKLTVDTYLSKFGFSDEMPLADKLSGGWKKRLSLAKVMMKQPDVLLLDEPTNHLDLESILWLEKFLLKESATFLLISHDRLFLQHMCNRVIELDAAYPNGLFAIDGPYTEFLKQKEIFLSGQLQQERSLASKLRKEKEWLQTSPKARTTKSKSRVESAEEGLEELAKIEARNLQKRASLDFTASERETKNLLAVKSLSKAMGGKTLFQKLDFTLSPGTKLALMGPNGTGKTTLLRMILGEEPPDSGTIKKADLLKIVYFDQQKQSLPSHLTLREALSPSGDYVTFQGQRIHVNGWCKRFLFSPDMLSRPLSHLSGGERARIAIAHLMLQPADILLLDEPTNDLDIPTLETLEESLLEFAGAVVLISHDRAMLDRVCNLFLALGQNALYADYAQWEQAAKTSAQPKKTPIKQEEPKTRKLSYNEKKEYEGIEKRLQEAEEQIHQLNLKLEDPANAEQPEVLQAICTEIGLLHTKIEQLYLRFEELDNIS
jgi:ABC transport system ATP-binding/permease protein